MCLGAISYVEAARHMTLRGTRGLLHISRPWSNFDRVCKETLESVRSIPGASRKLRRELGSYSKDTKDSQHCFDQVVLANRKYEPEYMASRSVHV